MIIGSGHDFGGNSGLSVSNFSKARIIGQFPSTPSLHWLSWLKSPPRKTSWQIPILITSRRWCFKEKDRLIWRNHCKYYYSDNTQNNALSCLTPRQNWIFVRLTSFPAWINNHIHNDMWNETTYQILGFNGCIIDVWELINNFIPPFLGMWFHILAVIAVKPCY